MRIALIGTSHWHAPIYLEAAAACNARVVAAWDIDEVRAQNFGRRFEVPHENDFEAAVAGVDLAILMGHPSFLPQLALRLIERGVPIVLEKPATSSTKKLVRLREAANAAHAFVAVPFANRLGPAMSEIQQIRATGHAGKVRHASFRLINGPPQRYRDVGVGWVLEPNIGGGGALRNLGIHGIDCANVLSQGRLRVVSSQIGRRIHVGEAVEDHALVTLVDEAGALFTVEAGYTFASMAPGGDFEWRVVTETETLIDRGDSAHAHELASHSPRELVTAPTETRYRLFMDDTLARLASGREPMASLDAYVSAMQLIDEAYLRATG